MNNKINNNINNTKNFNYNISYSRPSLHFNKNTTFIIKNSRNSSFSNNIISKIPNYPLLNYPPKKELTLILDLDETLISFQYSKDNKKEGILYLRPGLRIFLKEISELYEIILFTSSTREYASPIIDKIEKENKFFSGRLYREHNIIINNEYIKDISLLGRNIEKVIIVDNMIQNFRLQKDNGILIRWYCGDENDNVLFNLKKLLMRIYEEREDDVRNLIKKYKNEIIRKISSNL
jgi:CTD small phosphatase-like protein 2